MFEGHIRLSNAYLKAGIVGFTATRWKNQQVVPAGGDMEYLDIYNNQSVLELMKIDTLIIFDALHAIYKGKGL